MVREPLLLMPAAVMAPDAPNVVVVIDPAVTDAALSVADVTALVTDTLFADNIPDSCTFAAVKADAVKDPAVEKLAPVTAPVETEVAVRGPAAVMPVEPTTRPSALTWPDAVTPDTDAGPLTVKPDEPTSAEAALMEPVAVTAAADKVPDNMASEPLKTPTLVTGPETERDPPTLIAPAETDPAVIDAAVSAPAVSGPVDTLAERSRPVTEAVFATKPPDTTTSRDVSPSTTCDAPGPSRRTPPLAPVPASSTRSPPLLSASPAG
jgi:hypothetical protein